MNKPGYRFNDLNTKLNALSGEIVDCAFQVHKELGPGFFEINYEDTLIYELHTKGLAFEKQKQAKIPYKDILLPSEYGIGRYVPRNSVTPC